MGATIRDYAPGDEEAVVELSLRAWAPVFRSMEQVLGPEIFVRLHGDWQAFQERAVRDVLIDEAMHAWVAEAGGREPDNMALGPDEQVCEGFRTLEDIGHPVDERPDVRSHGPGISPNRLRRLADRS